jgi:L-xylulokinase
VPVAEVTGLSEGTPVVGGMFDIDASAAGCGAVNAGQACIIAGTWSINEVITAEPLVDPSLFMTTLFAASGLFLST